MTDLSERSAKLSGAVLAALGANIGVTVVKAVAAIFTGSAALASEAVHSSADSLNEVALLIGKHLGRKGETSRFPLGTSRARYLSAFVVSFLLFAVGGVYSIVQSSQRLVSISSSPGNRMVHASDLWIALGIVGVSAVLEVLSLRASLIEKRSEASREHLTDIPLWKFWARTSSSDLAAVLMEDILALASLATAGIGIGLSLLIGDEIYDGIAGVAVGVLLILGAIVLSIKSGSLLLGTSIGVPLQNIAIAQIEATPGVNRILHFQGISLSEDRLLIAVKIEITQGTDHPSLVDDIESRVRSALSGFLIEMFVEEDRYDASRVGGSS